MSLCRLMVLDFSEGIGRREGQAVRYSDGDLSFGAYYAADLIDQGYEFEPFLDFNLAAFAYWCCQQLGEIA